MFSIDQKAFEERRSALVTKLLAERNPAGHWEGELATSALSTATAVCALHHTDPCTYRQAIVDGLDWLAANCNGDGGWGDTVRSHSNISTTALCWAAFAIAPGQNKSHKAAVSQAETWLRAKAGGLDPQTVTRAIIKRYGEDHTFSVPILTMLALCGRLGSEQAAWESIPPLPFELAALPQRIFHWLNLPVVSYALPALIAIGQAIHTHGKRGNPISRLVRRLTRKITLSKLIRLQPANGGFLEAVPLTSFVVMSLSSMGLRDHPVVVRGIDFLLKGARNDGSWPIDTHLATWVTTLSINALQSEGERESPCSERDREAVRSWLLEQQYREVHPYTLAKPGGWSWTPLPGGVPDADDTSGALLALSRFSAGNEETRSAAVRGIQWLADLQNRDGGIPTFCRGWGTLPFDKSCPDITAHALAAMDGWRRRGLWQSKWGQTSAKALSYLSRVQRPDGSWVPLWFGNQDHPQDLNPTYGTAKVLSALAEMSEDRPESERRTITGLKNSAARWLVANQNEDGGWGGQLDLASSLEETGLSLEAMAKTLNQGSVEKSSDLGSGMVTAIDKGVHWLLENTSQAEELTPSPIGFYFASLWYFERLYPLIFTVGAFQAVAELVSSKE